MSTSTFVLDNVEVLKTGREAHKTLSSGKTEILFEVTPISPTSGCWKKWVRHSDLYEICCQSSQEG